MRLARLDGVIAEGKDSITSFLLERPEYTLEVVTRLLAARE